MNATLVLVSCVMALVLGAGCATPASGPRIDNLPMYGQPEIPRPDFLAKADADFVARVVVEFGGDRRKASRAWTDEASRFLERRNLDFAMRRLNQAWLLDHTNFQVYWGFGRVMTEADRFDSAARFMNQAITLCDDERQRPAIYSDLGATYSYQADALPADQAQQRAATFTLANEAFAKSTELDADYGNAWWRWSISLVMEGRYVQAAEKLKRARALGARPMPAALLGKLEAAVGPVE